MTTELYNPHPHRCAGLPEGTRAYVASMPQGERVLVYYDTPDGMDCLARAFRFCPGCGGHASLLLAVLRGEVADIDEIDVSYECRCPVLGCGSCGDNPPQPYHSHGHNRCREVSEQTICAACRYELEATS